MSTEVHVWNGAVQCNGRKGGWGLACKSVTARPPGFYNTRQRVPRNGWTKFDNLWGGRCAILPFPQRLWQCPHCCLGRQGFTHSCREASELQAKQLRELTVKSSAWGISTQHHWHDIDLRWRSRRLSCAQGCASTSCEPKTFSWISCLSSLQMFQLNYTNVHNTLVRLFYLHGGQFSPLGPRSVCSHFMKAAPK